MGLLFKKICISSDHAGFSVKEYIKDYLIKNIFTIDLGPYNNNLPIILITLKRLVKE